MHSISTAAFHARTAPPIVMRAGGSSKKKASPNSSGRRPLVDGLARFVRDLKRTQPLLVIEN